MAYWYCSDSTQKKESRTLSAADSCCVEQQTAQKQFIYNYILNIILCREKDIGNEEYIINRVVLTMLLCNIGGESGLRCVTENSFNGGCG